MSTPFKAIGPYLKKHKLRYIAGITCLVIVDAAQVLIPRFIKAAVDLVSEGVFDMVDIFRLALYMILTAAAISAGRFLWRFFIIGASRRIETEMRDRFFAHILGLSGGFFQKNKTGDLMARATNDIGAVRQALGMGFVSFVDAVFMSAMILVAMFAGNFKVALYSIIPLPFISILIFFFGRMVGGRFKRVQEVFSKMSDVAQETMAGMRVVKAFVKEEHFTGEFARTNDEYSFATMSLVRVFGLFFPLVSFLAGLSTLILLAVGGSSVIGNTMSAGDIVAMLAYLEMLIWPLMGAGFTVNTIQRGGASLKRLSEIMDTVPDIDSPEGAVTKTPEGRLSIAGLDFSYPGIEKPALAGISLDLEKGRTLGILGRVGSGKSTLLKLLPRLVDPPPGTIFLDGIDIRLYDLGILRKAFGFVPQDSFLFSDTVEENIRFGGEDLSAERFARIAAISTIDRDIATFPAGWKTVVGEKGLTLSGGQKQRVAISRALAADPEVLVLDDALSAVDTETEEKILAALLDERRGRTNIIVSHRVSTLRHADHIVVLDGGVVTQSGSHEELLMDQAGFYAEIARLQELESGAGSENQSSDGKGKDCAPSGKGA